MVVCVCVCVCGCPPDFVNIIRSFHEGMHAAVIEKGELSSNFDVTNGTKQGCVLPLLLFTVFTCDSIYAIVS